MSYPSHAGEAILAQFRDTKGTWERNITFSKVIKLSRLPGIYFFPAEISACHLYLGRYTVSRRRKNSPLMRSLKYHRRDDNSLTAVTDRNCNVIQLNTLCYWYLTSCNVCRPGPGGCRDILRYTKLRIVWVSSIDYALCKHDNIT